MITQSTYDDCLELLLSRCRQLGPEVVASVVLYGSMARNAVRPMESDVLDALVILQDAVLQNPERYEAVMEAMVDVCKQISRSGLPFHPFRYVTVSELGRVPAFELPCWESDRLSRTVLGHDLRHRFGTVDADLSFVRGAFFAGRRSLQAIGGFLAPHLSPGAHVTTYHRMLRLLTKIMPARACRTCGYHVDTSEALQCAERVFPGFDRRAFEDIQHAATDVAPLDDATIVRRAIFMLELNERLHDLVMAWLDRHDQRACARRALVEEVHPTSSGLGAGI